MRFFLFVFFITALNLNAQVLPSGSGTGRTAEEIVEKVEKNRKTKKLKKIEEDIIKNVKKNWDIKIKDMPDLYIKLFLYHQKTLDCKTCGDDEEKSTKSTFLMGKIIDKETNKLMEKLFSDKYVITYFKEQYNLSEDESKPMVNFFNKLTTDLNHSAPWKILTK